MKILVCMKQVPDTEKEIKIAPDGKSIERKNLPNKVNDFDKYALEEAIRLKEKAQGEVTALTVGPPQADEILREALAKGADKAVRLWDAAFEGSDPQAVARIIHAAVKDEGYDLIFTGVQAEDDGAATVGQALASLLGVAHASIITKVEVIDGKAKVHRELEGGREAVVEMTLPGVLTIQTGINEPRLASLMAILQAKNKSLAVKDAAGVGIDAAKVGAVGSRSHVEKVRFPPASEGAEMIEGSVEEQAAKVAKLLRDKGFKGASA